jgi:polyhydroxyalkanoate synthesis regulator phasin
MPGFGDIVQKAFYLGVGLATTAGGEAGERLAKLRVQAQKLADELVAKGEMNVEEARKMVDELMQQAQQQQPPVKPDEKASPSEPRRIEILSDDEGLASTDNQNVEALRQQVQAMQEELRRLKRK